LNPNFLIRVLLYIAMLVMAIYFVYVLLPNSNESRPPKTSIPIRVEYLQKSDRIDEATTYADSLGYYKELALLIDLTAHSGNYRLFGINLNTKDILVKGLVAHGHCQSTDNRFAQFSNQTGSNCSSLGHYKIGGKYDGNFGTSYKLLGKDTSNSNAMERYVVLHSHACIPNEEQDDDICLSEGCPTVSPEVLSKLEPLIDRADKPILLWIYADEL
jgi:hypothetical protein